GLDAVRSDRGFFNLMGGKPERGFGTRPEIVKEGEVGKESAPNDLEMILELSKRMLEVAKKDAEVIKGEIAKARKELIESAKPGEVVGEIVPKPPAPVELEAGIPRDVKNLVLDEEGIVNVAETNAKLPPQPTGTTKLYRVESPEVLFEDVFDVEKLAKLQGREAEILGGQFYTTELEFADFFRQTYGPDARIKYLDFPTEQLSKFEVRPGEFVIETAELTKKPAEAIPLQTIELDRPLDSLTDVELVQVIETLTEKAREVPILREEIASDIRIVEGFRGEAGVEVPKSPKIVPIDIADVTQEHSDRIVAGEGLPAIRGPDGEIFTRRTPAEHGDLIEFAQQAGSDFAVRDFESGWILDRKFVGLKDFQLSTDMGIKGTEFIAELGPKKTKEPKTEPLVPDVLAERLDNYVKSEGD
ncbi:hypothetical protein LCGC14_2774780, partial [marine sediment metagenome]